MVRLIAYLTICWLSAVTVAAACRSAFPAAMTDWQGAPLGLDSGASVIAAGNADLHAAAVAVLNAYTKGR